MFVCMGETEGREIEIERISAPHETDVSAEGNIGEVTEMPMSSDQITGLPQCFVTNDLRFVS